MHSFMLTLVFMHISGHVWPEFWTVLLWETFLLGGGKAAGRFLSWQMAVHRRMG